MLWHDSLFKNAGWWICGAVSAKRPFTCVPPIIRTILGHRWGAPSPVRKNNPSNLYVPIVVNCYSFFWWSFWIVLTPALIGRSWPHLRSPQRAGPQFRETCHGHSKARILRRCRNTNQGEVQSLRLSGNLLQPKRFQAGYKMSCGIYRCNFPVRQCIFSTSFHCFFSVSFIHWNNPKTGHQKNY
jgi:hypothetical protein